MAYTLTGLFCDAFKQIIFPHGVEEPEYFGKGITDPHRGNKTDRTGFAFFQLRSRVNVFRPTFGSAVVI